MSGRCAVCDRSAAVDPSIDTASDDVPPLGWSLNRTRRGAERIEEWMCPDCTRTNARAIEAKLEAEWW